AQSLGMGAFDVGVLTTISVLVGIVTTQLVDHRFRGQRLRVSLGFAGFAMMVTGVISACAPSRWWLYPAALLGFLPPLGGQYVAAVVEGRLAQTPAMQRTQVFARYGLWVNIVGAIGALSASVPTVLSLGTSFGLSVLAMSYGSLGLMIVACASGLVERSPISHRSISANALGETDPKGAERMSTINRLAVLFVVDASGSGVVTPTLVIFWLHAQFHMTTSSLAVLSFAMAICNSVSLPLAVKIARRLGLLNTAVVTHIASSLLLVAVPFAHSASVASGLLIVRAILVEMDVPTRQSDIASIVTPTLRSRAAARISIGKQTGRAIGPLVGGETLSALGAVAPFLIGGALKIGYDLALWRSFRHIRSVEEDAR
ncbi:MAG: MFS transporter, partial [Acidimicrobiales bacterium]